jgi:hypothetical protein
VVDHQIIDASIRPQMRLKLFEKIRKVGSLYRIDKSHLLVVNKIGVIGHSPGKRPEGLEERGLPVVRPHPVDILRHGNTTVHRKSSFLISSQDTFEMGSSIGYSGRIRNSHLTTPGDKGISYP